MFIVTAEWVESYKSGSGGWTKKQLASVGVDWPPEKGWKLRLIGSSISSEAKLIFESIPFTKAVKRKKKIAEKRRAKQARSDRYIASLNVTGDAFLSSYEWRKIRLVILKKYGRKCQCCGATPASGAIMNVDHIKPRKIYPELALTESNLQILCHECNHGKGNWDMTDFRPKETTENH